MKTQTKKTQGRTTGYTEVRTWLGRQWRHTNLLFIVVKYVSQNIFHLNRFWNIRFDGTKYTHTVEHPSSLPSEVFLHSKLKLYPQTTSPLPPSSGNHCSTVSMNLTIPDISGKRIHKVCPFASGSFRSASRPQDSSMSRQEADSPSCGRLSSILQCVSPTFCASTHPPMDVTLPSGERRALR